MMEFMIEMMDFKLKNGGSQHDWEDAGPESTYMAEFVRTIYAHESEFVRPGKDSQRLVCVDRNTRFGKRTERWHGKYKWTNTAHYTLSPRTLPCHVTLMSWDINVMGRMSCDVNVM